MVVRALGFDRMRGRVSRPQDVVEGSEARCHGVLADSSRLAEGASPCLVSFGVDSRRYTPPKEKFEILANST